MSKIYFSRSMTRAMAIDYPIGDPTGGVAYGEKNDPISAALSAATMAGTYTAAGSFAAMSLMQGVTFAGAAMSLVGSVTGNKTLSKIGMITGIAGGIGSLAESQQWISKTPSLGQTFGGSTGNAAQAMSSSSLGQSPSSAPSPNVQGANVNPLQQSSNAEFVNNENLARSGPIPPNLGTAPPIQNNMPVSLNQNVPPPKVEPPGFLDSLKQGNILDAAKAAGSAINPVTNPYGAMAVGQIAAPIADYLSGKTDAEIAALEAQTGYTDQRALQLQEEIAKEKRRRANLNQGYSQVDAGITVNPAVIGQAQAGGLIAGAVQPR